MKAAFSQASLTLTVNTLPSVDRRQLCYLPPRRSDKEEDLYTDIFSQSQGEMFFRISHEAPQQQHDPSSKPAFALNAVMHVRMLR